jgi:hypothetical protein
MNFDLNQIIQDSVFVCSILTYLTHLTYLTIQWT